jgi:hypothetical protein
MEAAIWICRIVVAVGLFIMLWVVLYKSRKSQKSCKGRMLNGRNLMD